MCRKETLAARSGAGRRARARAPRCEFSPSKRLSRARGSFRRRLKSEAAFLNFSSRRCLRRSCGLHEKAASFAPRLSQRCSLKVALVFFHVVETRPVEALDDGSRAVARGYPARAISGRLSTLPVGPETRPRSLDELATPFAPLSHKGGRARRPRAIWSRRVAFRRGSGALGDHPTFEHVQFNIRSRGDSFRRRRRGARWLWSRTRTREPRGALVGEASTTPRSPNPPFSPAAASHTRAVPPRRGRTRRRGAGLARVWSKKGVDARRPRLGRGAAAPPLAEPDARRAAAGHALRRRRPRARAARAPPRDKTL